jgi:opacity protein-like surface antigen
LAAVLLCLLVGGGTAYADTVRVVVDRALIWSSARGVNVVLAQVLKDAVLEVVRRVDDWYEVVLPPGASGSQQTVGYVRISQVTLESTGPPSPRAVAPPGRPGAPPPRRVAAPARARGARSSFLNLSGTYQQGDTDLTRRSAAFEANYVEAGSIEGTYGSKAAWQIDVLGGGAVSPHIGVGLGVSYQRRDRSATIDARVPHPFYFNQLRQATFETAPLRRQELALHIPVIWMPTFAGGTRLLVFGGPSVFHITQHVVTDLSLAESYPYDQVTVTGATDTESTSTVFGFHVGGDLSYMFRPSMGVGGGAQYSSGQSKFKDDADATSRGRPGGLQVSAGVRFRF